MNIVAKEYLFLNQKKTENINHSKCCKNACK